MLLRCFRIVVKYQSNPKEQPHCQLMTLIGASLQSLAANFNPFNNQLMETINIMVYYIIYVNNNLQTINMYIY